MPYKRLYLGYTYFILSAVMSVFLVCLRLYTLIKRVALKYYFAEKKIQFWRQNKQLLLSLADMVALDRIARPLIIISTEI